MFKSVIVSKINTYPKNFERWNVKLSFQFGPFRMVKPVSPIVESSISTPSGVFRIEVQRKPPADMRLDIALLRSQCLGFAQAAPIGSAKELGHASSAKRSPLESIRIKPDQGQI